MGALLWSQKEAEEKFESLNTVDHMHMEPYDSEQFVDEAKPLAYQNQCTIERNIPRLVRIFRRDDMRNRIMKDFKDSTTKNDTALFLEQFKLLKDLWNMKLCTSLEEYIRNQEQLTISTKRVQELEEQSKKKSTELDQFVSSSKDQREARQKEIDDLRQMHKKLNIDKKERESSLNARGQRELEEQDKAHQARK